MRPGLMTAAIVCAAVALSATAEAQRLDAIWAKQAPGATIAPDGVLDDPACAGPRRAEASGRVLLLLVVPGYLRSRPAGCGQATAFPRQVRLSDRSTDAVRPAHSGTDRGVGRIHSSGRHLQLRCRGRHRLHDGDA